MELHFNREQQSRTHIAILDSLGPEITSAQRAYTELFSYYSNVNNHLNISTACELAENVGNHIFDQIQSSSHKYAIFDLPSLADAVSSRPLAIFALRLCNASSRETEKGREIWTNAPLDHSLPKLEIKFPEDIRTKYEL